MTKQLPHISRLVIELGLRAFFLLLIAYLAWVVVSMARDQMPLTAKIFLIPTVIILLAVTCAMILPIIFSPLASL